MHTRPTQADIARRARVSVATVDRVLNRRRRVRPATEAAVLAAAKALSFRLPARRSHPLLTPTRTLGALLQKRSKPFYRRLGAQLRSASALQERQRVELELEFVDELAPGPIVESMRRLAGRVEALAVVAIDHPRIADEVAALRARSVPVVSLLSPLTAAGVVAHVGVDGRRDGRIAGWGMSRGLSRAGPVGILIGSHRYRSHEDRETGFRAYLRERPGRCGEIATMTYLDEDAGAYGTALELVARQPGLAGLYVIGGGTGGALRALEEQADGEEICVVCSEMGPAARDGLIAGTVELVTSTPIREAATATVGALLRSLAEPAALESVTLASRIHVSETV